MAIATKSIFNVNAFWEKIFSMVLEKTIKNYLMRYRYIYIYFFQIFPMLDSASLENSFAKWIIHTIIIESFSPLFY